MTRKYILDTHALVWYLEGNPRLGHEAKSVMASPNSVLVLPLIALAEATYLIQRGRIGIPSTADLLTDVRRDPRIEVYPLTWDVFARSLSTEALQIPELHDRFIVSTGLHLQDQGDTIDILTKDQTIVDANVLPICW